MSTAFNRSNGQCARARARSCTCATLTSATDWMLGVEWAGGNGHTSYRKFLGQSLTTKGCLSCNNS